MIQIGNHLPSVCQSIQKVMSRLVLTTKIACIRKMKSVSLFQSSGSTAVFTTDLQSARQNKVWETLTHTGEPARSIPGITAHWQTILTLSRELSQMNGCSVERLPSEGGSGQPDPPLCPHQNTIMSEVELSSGSLYIFFFSSWLLFSLRHQQMVFLVQRFV